MSKTVDCSADPVHIRHVGEVLDQLMTLDIGHRGAVRTLYPLARARVDEPLSIAAARLMQTSIAPGRSVVIATGFPVRPWISAAIGETDGPPGAAALAWALCHVLHAVPVIVCAEPLVAQIEGALRGAGLLVGTYAQACAAAQGSRKTVMAAVMPWPIGPDAVRSDPNQHSHALAHATLQSMNPAMVMSVEHPGANGAGVYHTAKGVDISHVTAHTHPLFAQAQQRNIPVISCADMVNEAGTGQLVGSAHALSLNVTTCACACGQGIAAAQSSDVVVIGHTANCAAYATVTALAFLQHNSAGAFSRQQERQSLTNMLNAGAIETSAGVACADAGTDGVASRMSGHILDLMHAAAGLAPSFGAYG